MLRSSALTLTLTLASLALAATPAWAQPAPAACPQLAEQLSELLASSQQRVGRDGEMRVEFEVDAQGRPRLQSLEGTRAYRSAVRIAMGALECQGGAGQRYLLTIRFDDSPEAVARSLAPQPLQALAQAPARP